MKIQHLIPLIGLGLFALFAKAEVIEFPEEELAQESVLPKFDKPDVVKNRNVSTAGKFEVAPFIGFTFTEPIYNPMKFGANFGYHWSEESAIVLNFAKYSSGLNTQYTNDLRNNYSLDFNRAPKINYSAYFNYEYKAYYGKISLTKQGTMNLSTYPLFGAGMTAFEHKSYPGITGGVGQKFYFGKVFALRVDLKLQYSQAPSPFLGDPTNATTPGVGTSRPVPSPGDFQDKWGFSTLLDLGASFVF